MSNEITARDLEAAFVRGAEEQARLEREAQEEIFAKVRAFRAKQIGSHEEMVRRMKHYRQMLRTVCDDLKEIPAISKKRRLHLAACIENILA
jgi:hypothetical protein